MYRNTLSIVLLIIPLSIFSQDEYFVWTGGNICAIENNPLIQEFEDEFEGSALDESKWQNYFPCAGLDDDQCLFSRTHLEGCGCDNGVLDCEPNEVQIYEEDNIVVNGNGTCSIKVRNESSSWFCHDTEFTSGVLHTRNPVNGFGRFEIKCKMPTSGAYWPNFWTFGWGYEFDVAEYTSGSYHPTIHNFNRSPKATDSSNEVFSFAGMTTYAVEYDPYRIKFFAKQENWATERLLFVVPRFITLDGQRITGCQNLEPQVLIVNPAFPKAGSPYNIIADVSLWSWVSNSNFQEDEMVIDYIKFEKRDIPCMGFNHSVDITEDKTYSWPKDFNSIIVREGATLTFENGTYNFDIDASILLEEGSSLVLNNATLSACDTELGWRGIVSKYGANITLNKGVIEDAKVGIDLRKDDEEDPNSSLTINRLSGIRDCKTAIALNEDDTNISIADGTFIADNEIGIHASRSTGLILDRMQFVRNDIGILAEDSYINVRDGNAFLNDDIGISLEGTYPGSTGIDIGDSGQGWNLFASNRIGIQSLGSEHAAGANVVNCDFRRATSAAAIFDGANEFSFTNNTIQDCDAGCGALTTGENFNDIDCNEVENTSLGLVFIRDNIRLQFRENEFTGTQNISALSLVATIANQIGEAENPAGNCFDGRGEDIVTLGNSPFTYNFFDDSDEEDCQEPMTDGNYVPNESDDRPEHGCESPGKIEGLISAGDPCALTYSSNEIKQKILELQQEVVALGGDDPATDCDESSHPVSSEIYNKQKELDAWIRLGVYYGYCTDNHLYVENLLKPLESYKWQKQLYGLHVTKKEYQAASEVLESISDATQEQIYFKAVQSVNLKRLDGLLTGPVITAEDINLLQKVSGAPYPTAAYAKNIYRILTGERIPSIDISNILIDGVPDIAEDDCNLQIYQLSPCDFTIETENCANIAYTLWTDSAGNQVSGDNYYNVPVSGMLTVSIYDADDCLIEVASIIVEEVCEIPLPDEICTNINDTSSGNGDWSAEYVIDGNGVISLEFFTASVPDQLIVYVNGLEVTNSGDYSSYNCDPNYADCQGTVVFGCGADFIVEIPVSYQDMIEVQVYGNTCNSGGTYWSLDALCIDNFGAANLSTRSRKPRMDDVESIKLQLLPNPTSANISGTLSGSDITRIEILDTAGRLHNCRYRTAHQHFEVFTVSLVTGIYYIKVYDTKGFVHIQKILKI